MVYFYNVTAVYDKGAGVRNIDLAINKGELVFLTGVSGAGKSTILRLIYMDIFPQRGKVVVRNFDSSNVKTKDIPRLRRKIGMVFQDFKLLPDRNVLENVAISLYLAKINVRRIKRVVLGVLNQVGLGHRVYYYPHELSGGEQQRVAIARALIKNPLVMLADEPTGNLDYTSSMDVLDLLKRINKTGTPVIIATHDRSLIDNSEGTVYEMHEGEIIRNWSQ